DSDAMSRLRIFPPVAIVYPNDRQLFGVLAEPPPPMWVSVTDSGDIKNDFSLEVDPLGSQVTGFSAHLLQSGIGQVELTIDDQCRPTGSNVLSIIGFIVDIVGLVYNYNVKINSTTVEVRDELNNQLFTQSYSTVSGDIYRMELAAGFRLYRNGALLHSRVSLPTTVIYPQRYAISIVEPTATAPTRIPPPRLIGEWQLSPFVTWTAPSHGSLVQVDLTDRVEYFGGTVRGTYTLTAQIDPSADAGGTQRATATIEIPPLKILGPIK